MAKKARKAKQKKIKAVSKAKPFSDYSIDAAGWITLKFGSQKKRWDRIQNLKVDLQADIDANQTELKEMGVTEFDDRAYIIDGIIAFQRKEKEKKKLQEEKELAKKPAPVVEEQEEQPKEFPRIEELTLNPAGGIVKATGLVYEPIGRGWYAFNLQGVRGLAKAKPVFAPTTNKQAKRKLLDFALEIDGQQLFFQEKPLLHKLPWQIPEYIFFEEWKVGGVRTPTGEQIFNELRTYFRTFLDFPLEYCYDVAVVANLQTWVKHILPSVAFVCYEGEFGGGKSTALEAATDIQRHGILGGNVSTAALPRLIQDWDCSINLDEVEVKANRKDDDTWLSIRQANRRGNFYIRMNPGDKTTLDIFSQFTVISFTAHGIVEVAAKTRSIPIPCRKSKDSRLPAVNMVRSVQAGEVLKLLYAWYLDNAWRQVAVIDAVATVATLPDNPEGNRTNLWNALTKKFSQGEIDFILAFTGRNNELAITALLVCRALGLSPLFLEGLKTSLKLKAETEADRDLNSYETILALVLKDWHGKTGLMDSTGTKFVVQADVYKDYLSRLSLEGLSLVSAPKFHEHLMGFGFLDNVNRKKAKVKDAVRETTARCLFFDANVIEKILPPTPSPPEVATDNHGNNGNQTDPKCVRCGQTEGQFFLKPEGQLCHSCTIQQYPDDFRHKAVVQ
ncbi:MAG: hypothetical protein V1494_00585 [Candidatus Diapherotrites archaeon]